MTKVMTAKKAPKDLDAYSADDWSMEPKLDGFRATIQKHDGKVSILSRTGKSQAGKLPIIEAIFEAVPADNFILDGELVWLEDNVRLAGFDYWAPLGDFNKTMRVMGSNPAKAIAKQDEFGGSRITFFAFDALEIQGQSILHLPQRERRELTETLVKAVRGAYVRITPQYDPSQYLYDAYVDAGGEGMMLKRKSAPYSQRRSGDLLKVKAQDTLDAVVMGFTPGEGKYSDAIGAIVFGQYENGELVKVGQCSGFTDAQRYDMANRPEAYVGEVVEVKHYGMVTEANLEGLRHPTFVRFRDDKRPEECTK